jgi:hypothetical protein
MKSTSAYAPAAHVGPGHAHSKARAVFRFFLYLGFFVMFTVFTWGQDSPGDDPKASLAFHAIFIFITLVILIGEAIAMHSYDLLTTRIAVPDQNLGEEIFGVVLITLFWSLYYGLRWQSLPAGVYANHLEGKLAVVFAAILLIILWSEGIFDRRKR